MNDRACLSVGIDLGTTFSSMAYVDRQLSPKMVLNDSGQSIVPSVVFFDEDEIVVGDMALEHSKIDAERVVQFIKIHMGERWRREFNGHVYTPETISAIILRHLVIMAEPQLGPISSAVVTVPAFFNEKRRIATQQAGEIAGLEVLGTLNEPMAATLAYGLHHQDEEQTVLVYDLGGGTFDVTVVRINPMEIRELATDGNRQLGGKDWDQALIDIVSEEFMARHGLDPRADPQGAQDLQLACEKAKRILSKKNRASVRINVRDHDHVTEITREIFEDRTRSLLDATRLTTELVLAQAGLTWDDVSRVVPVGGSTLMPAVRMLLSQLKGSPPETSVNPVMAVALGAAIYAHILESGGAFKTVTLRSGNAETHSPEIQTAESQRPKVYFVTAHGVGIRARDGADGHWKNFVLIPKNSRVPARSSPRRFQLDAPSHDNSFVKVEITQGDAEDLAAAEILGEARITGFPPRPPEPASSADRLTSPMLTEFVDVTLEFDEQGRLHMSADYLDSSRNARQTAQMTLQVAGGLRPEQVQEEQRRLELVDFPRLQKSEY